MPLSMLFTTKGIIKPVNKKTSKNEMETKKMFTTKQLKYDFELKSSVAPGLISWHFNCKAIIILTWDFKVINSCTKQRWRGAQKLTSLKVPE